MNTAGAAFSSILTCPLAASLTADSVLTFNSNQAETAGDEEEGKTDAGGNKRDMPRLYFMGLIFIMVIVSTVVICFNGEIRRLTKALKLSINLFPVDRTYVILVAQVFNGCLLPLFSSCLLLCLNDRTLMSASPQSGPANLALLLCVTLTFVFTANVLLQKLLGHLISSVATRLGLALALGVLGMASVCLLTSLGRDIITSVKK